MNIRYFCPYWGSESFEWLDFCKRIKDSGYNGVEYAISSTTTDSQLEKVWNAVEKVGVEMLIQHFDTAEADFNKHYELFANWLDRITIYPHIRLNSQTGRDLFTFEQNKKLLELGSKFGARHELHRGKALFAPHISAPLISSLPKLRLTLDLSHWVCVAESWLEDQQIAVDLAISRTDHIHARVGFPEGPQIADPRAPEWAEALERHLSWWDKVVLPQQQTNELLTISPEFGPYPYMPQRPYSREPLADQWEVNIYMLQLLKERYSKLV